LPITAMINVRDLVAVAEQVRTGSNVSADDYQFFQSSSDDAGRMYHDLLSKVGHRQLLKDVPGMLKTVMKTESWRRWRWLEHEFTAPSLGAYLTRNPPAGLGVSLDMAEALVRNDAEILAIWREATTAEKHVHTDGDNVTIKPERGNKRAYTLDRLKRERPDLFQLVVAGELSANAAAIEAGFRKKTFAVPDDIKLAAKALAQHFGPFHALDLADAIEAEVHRRMEN